MKPCAASVLCQAVPPRRLPRQATQKEGPVQFPHMFPHRPHQMASNCFKTPGQSLCSLSDSPRM